MDLPKVLDVLHSRVQQLAKSNADLHSYVLTPYKETEQLIRACGHDTTELHQAILAASETFDRLQNAREKAASKFKAQGVCFTVDEARRQEIEQSRLQ